MTAEVAMSVEGPPPASTLTLRKPYLEKRRDSEDSTLRMSLTAAGPNEDASRLPSSPMSGKRKQPELNAAGKFKAVSQLVVAMNRFKGELEENDDGRSVVGRWCTSRIAAINQDLLRFLWEAKPICPLKY